MDILAARAGDIAQRALAIRLLALDVDGVLTAGEIIYNSDGQEVKHFNILDGLGIKLLQESGIEVAIITGRRSSMVERRASELGISELIQGREDKLTALTALCRRRDIGLAETAYIGDDLPDLQAIRAVGLGVTVANAHPLLREHALLCTTRRGGSGAVREFADYLLQAQNRYQTAIDRFL